MTKVKAVLIISEQPFIMDGDQSHIFYREHQHGIPHARYLGKHAGGSIESNLYIFPRSRALARVTSGGNGCA